MQFVVRSLRYKDIKLPKMLRFKNILIQMGRKSLITSELCNLSHHHHPKQSNKNLITARNYCSIQHTSDYFQSLYDKTKQKFECK